MKKLKRTYTRCAGLTALVLLALLIAGSFADLPISRFLYPGHESSFGQFFAAFGELPAFALLASCGVLWGFRTLGELQQAGADHIAETPAALQALILGQ